MLTFSEILHVTGPTGPRHPSFLTHFGGIEDPRQQAKVTYPLNEIFLLVLCAVISGAEGWTSIALYGEKKLKFLRRFLPFKDGTPSHDQLGTFFLAWIWSSSNAAS